MARMMALDVGSARIGVAVSDYTGMLASPYTTIQVPRDEETLWELLRRVVEDAEAEQVIIGLPVSLDGQIHAQGERIQAFARRFAERIDIPYAFWDERLSTVTAQRLRDERGDSRSGRQKKKKRNQQSIDALAAAVILQDYLDHRSQT